MGSDGLSKHERRMLRRQEKKQQEGQQAGKGRKTSLYAGALMLVLAIGGFAFAMWPPEITGNAVGNAEAIDLSGIPSQFVHWHADLDVIVCGKEMDLPTSPPNSMLGTPTLHTHDFFTNQGSLAGSDGNGIIHNEGQLLQNPGAQTVGAFLDQMSIPFSRESIAGKSNGDLCGETPGTVKFFVNDKENPQFRDYIPRDGDFIRIEFS